MAEPERPRPLSGRLAEGGQPTAVLQATALLALPPERLAPAELAHACRASFMLHPKLTLFMSWELPRLLRHLRSVNERRLVDDRRVDGHVHWPSTLRARASGGPGRFVVRRAHRSYDLPENQLLQHLLTGVRRTLFQLPAEVKDGLCYAGAAGPSTPAPERLGPVSVGLGRARRDERLSALTDPGRVSEEALRRARDTGMASYQSLAELGELQRSLLDQPSAAGLRAVAQDLLVLPTRAGPWLLNWPALALELSRAVEAPAAEPRRPGEAPTAEPPKAEAPRLRKRLR